jgi:ribosome-binding factor A
MVSSSRAKKIGQRMQEELADLLQKEAADPGLAMVTVTDVDVDKELAFATVYVSTLDADDRKDEVLHALRRARGARIDELLQDIHRGDDSAEGEA